MMASDQHTAWLSAALDRELSLWRRWRLRRHLAGCTSCAARMEELQSIQTALRGSLTYHRAPPGLAPRIGNVLPRESAATPRRRHWRVVPLAGSGLVGALAGVALMLLVLSNAPHSGDGNLTQGIVDSHVRAMLTDHMIDVQSSDQHTVKPWLSAHVDVSPSVRDFAAEGFPLLGGRQDYVDGHECAVVIYRRAKHIIDLYAWAAPDAADAPFQQTTHQGYNLILWRHGGIAYAAVSDTEMSQLVAFTRLVMGDG
jgi:anti-sigma factor RsiW